MELIVPRARAVASRLPAVGVLPTVVVGAGPVGVHFVDSVLREAPDHAVILFGGEPWGPYNRVQLSALLAGEKHLRELDNWPKLPADARVAQHFNCSITAIDREQRYVLDDKGRRQHYGRLVLATGSVPFRPAIAGASLFGVYTFRDLKDVARLRAQRARSRRVVVLGGGLLGLEVARAMHQAPCAVTVIERGPHLMGRQLDAAGADLLAEHLRALGIAVYTGQEVAAIEGAEHAEAVRLADGRLIACDSVVIATGVVPNTQLARFAGLAVGRGIRVNERMQTSDPLIYAIGECAEFRGEVLGLVAPGLEQARVAAVQVLGGQACYEIKSAASSLKVVGQTVVSAGEATAGNAAGIVYRRRGRYRKLLMREGRLVGVCGVGDWPEFSELREAVGEQRALRPWQLWRFRLQGQLGRPRPLAVSAWPEAAVVCNCLGVTRGSLSSAIAGGADSLPALMRATSASTACGSCRPLLQELVGALGADTAGRAPWSRALAALSLLSLLAGVLLASLAPIPYSQSVQQAFRPDVLWSDGLYKQISGFSLLAAGLIAMIMSARKRIRRFRLGGYPGYRLFHAAVAFSMLGLLAVHTGLRVGDRLNQALMLGMLGLTLAGAVTGLLVAQEARLGRDWGPRLRRWSGWVHLLLSWPLPVLLGFHILAVYYF